MNALASATAADGRNLKWLGIFTIVLGFLAIAAPLLTGLSIAVLVGVLVMAGGINRLIWAFQAGSFGKGMLRFVIGVLTLLCGIALVTDPVLASGVLTIMLAAYFLVDGVFEIAGAFQVRPAPGWGWMLVGGIFSVLLAVMIWRQFPLSGAWAMGVLLGIKLLFVGMIMLGVGRTAQSEA